MSTSLLLCIIWIILEFSPSSIHLHLQVIFVWTWIITGSRSSLEHHHWIWIITGASSLDLDHHLIWIITGASSLDLDHYWIWIIIAGLSSLYHHGCYLMILLVTGSSTELSLFHAGCRPSLHVGLLQRLYLTLSQNGPTSTYILP